MEREIEMIADKLRVVRLEAGTDLWRKAISFAENCSWPAGGHFAEMLTQNAFSDWEAAFVAEKDGQILGFCTFLKEDYYPENRYSPWISSIFVAESARGHRISHRMIDHVIGYAREHGFHRVYIPSDMTGFYEKCGFEPIDTLQNYGGDFDTVFVRNI